MSKQNLTKKRVSLLYLESMYNIINMINLTRTKATANDFNLLYEINELAIKEHVVKVFGPWDPDDQLKNFKETTVCEDHEIIYLNDCPIGFINIERKESSIHLNRICIVPEYQSKGIGTELLKELLVESKENYPVTLQVFHSNPARNLYKRLGFKEYKKSEIHLYLKYEPTF